MRAIFGPAYAIAKRLEAAAKENAPVIVLLRGDGTADIKLPRVVGDGFCFFTDRSGVHFVVYDKHEVYRLPGGTPLIVAVEGVPVAADRAKLLLARALADAQVRRKLGSQLAPLLERIGEGAAVERLKQALAEGDLAAIQTAANLLDFRVALGYVAVDAAAIRELANPLQRTERIRIYYEKKTHAFLEKVLQLKLAYETGWSRILKFLAPLLVFAIIFAVLAYLLPQVFGTLSQTVRVP